MSSCQSTVSEFVSVSGNGACPICSSAVHVGDEIFVTHEYNGCQKGRLISWCCTACSGIDQAEYHRETQGELKL